ncbi:sodium- and chloride-dependent neutral and basic amino acid transporter B(0+)-like [Leucoraja erinacea]|uniref:sodium- and chloride-dependent neutral and basic amino acid transporter B(0+)-like n=1 Tax=Leucoraja erinaceus TaxID=7782 RepID=UPI00245391B7|nr:sodium- and chloride-dependent neutral and basic amino acid transporter B(0+)-like [Leucoraja erinacea]
MDRGDLGLTQCERPPLSAENAAATDGDVGESDENVERGNWSSKTDYLLSVIGCAVGLGNVWRFPYLAYKNGGGAFLIPFGVMLALAGMPMFFLDSSFGQFSSMGPVGVWKAVPILQGVGITMVLFAAIGVIYYNCIIAYSLFYLFASFQSPLPWSDCFSWWGADETCSRTPRDPLCNLTLDGEYSGIVNTTWLQANNKTCSNESEIHVPHQGPSEQYWDKGVLQRSTSIDEMGEIVWNLALCLLLAWFIIGASLSRGIKSSGKVWKDAATQIFFSLSVGSGSLITLSSYNKFHNNCYRDTIVVCVVNCATSVFAGFVIFSVLGHMAHVQDKPVSEVAQSGFGLVFIAYPEALAQLPWAPLWSVLFFFMLITLGLDTQFATVETNITILLDMFPSFLRTKRLSLTIAICLSFYVLGLVYVTQAGIYWINLLDHFCAGWILITAALLELIGLGWIYGVNRFIRDIETMIGEKDWMFWLWWRVCWCFISPCLLVVVLAWSLVTFTPPTYGLIEYPTWAIALGWCTIIFCIMWIPIIAIVKVVQAEGSTLYQKISAACVPAPDWGPYLEQHRVERYRNNPDLQKL